MNSAYGYVGALLSCLAMVVLLGTIFFRIAYAEDDFSTQVAAGAPPIPPGYKSYQEMIEAAKAGVFECVTRNTPTPGDLVERKDIEYGRVGETSLRLDLLSPANLDTPVPGIIFVHGGGWGAGTSDDVRVYAVACAKMGYVCAAINYRLSQEAPFPAQVQDPKCAVRWMRANATKLNVDPDHIAIGGVSAGGHMAMMVAYATDVPEFEGNGGYEGISSQVQAVIDYYGPTNVAATYFRDTPYVRQLMGSTLYTDDPRHYEQASPLNYVTKNAPPTLIFHGTTDEYVPIREADNLVAKLKECGVPYLYDRVEGWPHVYDANGQLLQRCKYFMKTFLDKYLPIPVKHAG